MSTAGPYVAVVGPGEASESERRNAHTAGRLLAERGAVVVTGGLGGVMAAAAQGVRDVAGIAVALLPGPDRAAADPANSIAIATGLGELRNGLIVRTVDAVLCIGGSWGTLSEVALAVRRGVPVVVLGGWDLPAAPGLQVAQSVEEAVESALAAVTRRK